MYLYSDINLFVFGLVDKFHQQDNHIVFTRCGVMVGVLVSNIVDRKFELQPYFALPP
jgi:hypothetical protein